MLLRTSSPSPFGRKVKITAKILGVYDKLKIELADTTNPEDSLRKQNPIGKIPILVLSDGTSIYDSRVICEYLNDTYEGTLFPDGEDKIPTLILQSLADGITDAGILQLYEARFRPEDKHSEVWLEHQKGKIIRGLEYLEDHPPSLNKDINIGHISLACALGFLDFRFSGSWRDKHKNLVTWLENFSERVPAFDETPPTD